MDRAFTVAQVNRYIKRLMEKDALLCELQVEGELSNFKRHSSGHLYFTLKDASASINCVMFASYAAALFTQTSQTAFNTPAFEPENGTKVIITGHVSLYEKTGQYQLYAVHMKPVGEGDLAAAFVKLRDSLKAQGLFDPDRKKAIPAWVRCVALVTSPTGAAVQDMIKVIRSRNPGVKIVVVPTLVQGPQAAPEIARTIRMVNEWRLSDSIPSAGQPDTTCNFYAGTKADVMIVGRGGGSMEDLWAFNEEIVARAIADSQIPVISAIGHETDFTIADFAADLRAPTPSAAAASAVADVSEQFLRASVLRQRADRAIKQACIMARGRLNILSGHSCLTRPMDGIAMRQLHTRQLTKDMERLIFTHLQTCASLLKNRTQLLEKVSPYALWKRGYAAVCTPEGVGIRSVKELHPGQAITFHMKDGEASAEIFSVKPNTDV